MAVGRLQASIGSLRERSHPSITGATLAERHQLQKGVEREWDEWQRRTVINCSPNGAWHDVFEPRHVEYETRLQFQASFWRDA